MPIPVLTPRVPDLPLPTDIMQRMAASNLARTRAQVAQQTGLPMAQAMLQQQQQQTQQAAQAFPLIQQLRQAKLQLDPAKAAALRSQVALAPSREALFKAQAASFQRKAEDPFSGQILPGPAGMAQGLQILAARVGVNSPVYKKALDAYNAKLKLQNARANYYTSNVGLKNLPKLQKQQITANWQRFNANRGRQGLAPLTFQDWLDGPGANLVPTDKKVTADDTVNHTPVSTVDAEDPLEQGKPHGENTKPALHSLALQVPPENSLTKEQSTITPEDFQSENKQTQLAIAKASSDPKIFRKWINFNNIVNVMNKVDPAILERYAGPQGMVRIARDRALELSGHRVPAFEKYNDFIRITVPTISDMQRQAYGTSIDPRMFDILKSMSNPITWKNSPALAVSQWHKLLNLSLERQRVLGHFVGISKIPGEAPPVSGEPTATTKTTADLVKQFRGE